MNLIVIGVRAIYHATHRDAGSGGVCRGKLGFLIGKFIIVIKMDGQKYMKV